MTASEQSPWCTRAEAAGYLGFEEVETIDAKLTQSQDFTPGKLRYRVMKDNSARSKVRVWRADVLAMLPPFED